MVASAAERTTYSLGVVPQFEQRKLFSIWQPIIDELEQQLTFDLQLIGSPKIPVFEKKFLAGEYDFAYMNPYHVLKANQSQGYIPLVRDASRQLTGIVVVKKDSPYTDPSQLEKKIIAFPSPNALGASLMTRADLSALYRIEFFPRYVQTHSSVYLNVALGQTAAGGGVLSTFSAQPDEVKARLRILYETRGVNPHPLAAHPRVPEADREALKTAWLELAATEEGQALMARIPMIQPIPASMSDYSALLDWGLDQYYFLE
ncbi:MAG: phosphate/phosphite/phosphonate ABC transporter substrate-binding protein [Oceanospirillales bacterium]|nr:phosphate/phosphite/phosphonate ABC transporter substrate-binding protein [Oceanospirillales bacterium]